MIYPICGAEFENTDGHSRIVTGALERWYRIGDAIRWDTKTEQERSQVARSRRSIRSIWTTIARCARCKTLFDAPAATVVANRITSVCLLAHEATQALFGFDRTFWGIVGCHPAVSRWVVVQDCGGDSWNYE